MFVCILHFLKHLSSNTFNWKEKIQAQQKKNEEVTEKVMIVIIINALQAFLLRLFREPLIVFETYKCLCRQKTGSGVEFNWKWNWFFFDEMRRHLIFFSLIFRDFHHCCASFSHHHLDSKYAITHENWKSNLLSDVLKR
jgi:hypothetical protein